MTKLQESKDKNKFNSEKESENLLSIDDVKNDIIKIQNPFLADLLKIQNKIAKAASSDIVKRPPLISRYDAKCGEDIPIIAQSTINMIQGKNGTHKSRLAELFCSLLLSCDSSNTDFLQFFSKSEVTVVFIDTERNLQEQFPEAIQRIREKAGYVKTTDVPNFHFFSLMKMERQNRLDAVKELLNHVQSQSQKPMFVVLDVVTDCISDSNNSSESYKLYDILIDYADEFNATFLMAIHENPATEKARGHLGTEGQNKASTVIQIGYDDPENSDLMKLKFIKTRSSARPKEIYIKYSPLVRGLILADNDEVSKATDTKKKNFDTETVKDFLENLLIEPVKSKAVNKKISEEFKINERLALNKISELIDKQEIFNDTKGRECNLIREKKEGNKRLLLLSLIPINKTIQAEILFD